MEHLPNNAVKIYNQHTILGTGVANFFRKRGITYVSIILDYKHQSIILWGNTDINNNSSKIIEHHGYKILYSGMTTRTNEGVRLPMIVVNISKYLDPPARYYIAKPLNKYAIILENALLTGPEIIRQKNFSNMQEQYIVLGKPEIGRVIKPEQLIRKEQKLQVSKTPLQTTQTYTQLSNTNSQKNPQKALKMQENHEKNIEQNNEQPIQNTSTSEEIERVENEYKKMILGE